ncbi:hypothetical protein L211DRAFT_590905 [Terfezia boudieri ATCC MYA-4762]|uniref:Uncharacterized protein n=1 Tax=Terfezia boudieri ATCC MYA-4762 TaxID=1051890 RepID=A0A3N4LA77_9PEZI|nr:hypothetical protein L211DRAFT_590905 [Terfezia boudieri ATCC MYA-4762]
MSTYPGRRKRKQHCSQDAPQKRQLPLLAPKGKTHQETTVLQLEHNNIRDEQTTESPAANVKFQHPANSQSSQSYIPTVSSAHDSTSPSFLLPNSTGSSLKAVAPCMDINFSRGPSTLVDSGFPEFVRGNLVPAADTYENAGLSTHHLLYDKLQRQETTQGQDYWIPTLDAPEDAASQTTVWAAIAQPTISLHQGQSTLSTADRPPPASTEHSAPVQFTYLAPLQQNPQAVACVNCPSIWRSHLEIILFSVLEDKGISDLKRSYRHFQEHIHEAHHYGAGCALCENLLYHHLGKMILLEAAGGGFTDAKISLGISFMTLREHIQEAHGGC